MKMSEGETENGDFNNKVGAEPGPGRLKNDSPATQSDSKITQSDSETTQSAQTNDGGWL